MSWLQKQVESKARTYIASVFLSRVPLTQLRYGAYRDRLVTNFHKEYFTNEK